MGAKRQSNIDSKAKLLRYKVLRARELWKNNIGSERTILGYRLAHLGKHYWKRTGPTNVFPDYTSFTSRIT